MHKWEGEVFTWVDSRCKRTQVESHPVLLARPWSKAVFKLSQTPVVRVLQLREIQENAFSPGKINAGAKVGAVCSLHVLQKE